MNEFSLGPRVTGWVAIKIALDNMAKKEPGWEWYQQIAWEAAVLVRIGFEVEDLRLLHSHGLNEECGRCDIQVVPAMLVE